MKLTPEQSAAVDKLAWKLVVVEPQDRAPAMLLIVDEYAKAVRAEHPDLSDDKIEDAVLRYSTIILQRVDELTSTVSGEGHA